MPATPSARHLAIHIGVVLLYCCEPDKACAVVGGEICCAYWLVAIVLLTSCMWMDIICVGNLYKYTAGAGVKLVRIAYRVGSRLIKVVLDINEALRVWKKLLCIIVCLLKVDPAMRSVATYCRV